MKSKYLVRTATLKGMPRKECLFGNDHIIQDVVVYDDNIYQGIYPAFLQPFYTPYMDLMELKCTTRIQGHNCIDMWMERIACIMGKFYSVYQKYEVLGKRYV